MFTLRNRLQIYLFFLISAAFWSCSGNESRWDVNVSEVKVDVKIERFDKDFDALRPLNNLEAQLNSLGKKYQFFYADYVEQIVNAGFLVDPNKAYVSNIQKILTGKPYHDIKNEVNKVYTSLDAQNAQLVDACKHLKYHYPEMKFPRFIAFFSGFEVQIPIGDGYVGIGLDMFLGKNNPYYNAITAQVPKYITRRFAPEYMVPNVMEAFVREDMYPKPDHVKSLIDQMIYHGKIMVCLDAIMPNCPDSIKIGYTSAQMNWCKNNESNIWALFVGEDLLYKTDFLQIDKFIQEAPFTPGLGERKESAPKLGRFIGWQIVRKYMNEHPDISLKQLMEEKDYQKILREAAYKPK